jgi:uncharacterized protein (TIGR03032 family)
MPNFPALLRQLGASLLVTTYQAGKLVMVRDKGDRLNTHYRAFPSPKGPALADGGAKLAIGTTIEVWEFRDVPSVARCLEPTDRQDACFLPRSSHVTGNVLIHEMAYGAGGEFWFVNTRFACKRKLRQNPVQGCNHDVILSRAVNVRPLSPCKRVWTPP